AAERIELLLEAFGDPRAPDVRSAVDDDSLHALFVLAVGVVGHERAEREEERRHFWQPEALRSPHLRVAVVDATATDDGDACISCLLECSSGCATADAYWHEHICAASDCLTNRGCEALRVELAVNEVRVPASCLCCLEHVRRGC